MQTSSFVFVWCLSNCIVYFPASNISTFIMWTNFIYIWCVFYSFLQMILTNLTLFNLTKCGLESLKRFSFWQMEHYDLPEVFQCWTGLELSESCSPRPTNWQPLALVLELKSAVFNMSAQQWSNKLNRNASQMSQIVAWKIMSSQLACTVFCH